MVESTQVIHDRVLKEYGNYSEEVLDSQPEKVASKVGIVTDAR